MRNLLFSTVIAMGMGAGCAHSAVEGNTDMRGTMAIGQRARLLVTGPVSEVHTSAAGGRPASLFLVDAINGDDRDCARGAGRETPVATGSEGRARLRVPPHRELCAVSPASTEVSFHAHVDTRSHRFALK